MAKSDANQQYPQSRLHQPDDLNLGEFFKSESGGKTVVTNKDLEATVPNKDKNDLVEVERYWVNKPYAFVVVYKSKKEKEHRYYLVEPQLSEEEEQLVSFLKDKIRVSLDYDDVRTRATAKQRVIRLREKALELLENYNLVSDQVFQEADITANESKIESLVNKGIDLIYSTTNVNKPSDKAGRFDTTNSDTQQLTRNQTEKVIYYVIRDFIRYDKVDGIMQDNQVEDLSVDGWDGNVFIVHSKYEQMITNVSFGKEDLDEFVTALAQKAKKGISKRQPNIDATLEDGSRAILMLGDEITDKGTSFTIRQFNNIPFTPVDLINWNTYSIDEMVYLWLCVENGKSGIIAGGTASGKTTTLNAISLFIPATKKIVSIEDTRELEVPQSHWIPLMTREAHDSNNQNTIDETDLLWNSLRMRPNYVIYGEVRGEEARSLFQNLNTGHTAYSTFHANNSEQVRVRLTTDPINVDDTSFAGLDFIITQAEVTVAGRNERRAKSVVELEEYNPHNESFSIEKPFVWNQSDDVVEGDLSMENIQSNSPLMQEIRRENGWSRSELQKEIKRRKIVLSYLIDNNINEYVEVSSILQGYMYSKETVLAKIADGSLAAETGRFKNIKNIDIDINPELEEGVPRPNPDERQMAQARDIMQTNEEIYQNVSADMDQLEKQLGDVLELEGETREVTQEEELAGVTYGAEEESPEEETDETDEENSEYGYNDYDGGE